MKTVVRIRSRPGRGRPREIGAGPLRASSRRELQVLADELWRDWTVRTLFDDDRRTFEDRIESELRTIGPSVQAESRSTC